RPRGAGGRGVGVYLPFWPGPASPPPSTSCLLIGDVDARHKAGHDGANTMDRWLTPALDYIPRWIEFQMQASQQPGCIVAVAHRDKIVLERAFGFANLETGEPLTPRH